MRVDSANCIVLDKECTSSNPSLGFLNQNASLFVQAIASYWKNSTPPSCFFKPEEEAGNPACAFPSDSEATSEPLRPLFLEMLPVEVFANATLPVEPPLTRREEENSISSVYGYGADRTEQPTLAYMIFASVEELNGLPPSQERDYFGTEAYTKALATGNDGSFRHSVVYTASHDTISGDIGKRAYLGSTALSIALPLLVTGTPRFFQGTEMAADKDFTYDQPTHMEWSLLVRRYTAIPNGRMRDG